MKSFKKNILLPACFVLMLVFPAYSQSGQLEREIRIAERIIEELFSDLQPETGFQRAFSPVRSEYIPGTGLHFFVGGNDSGFGGFSAIQIRQNNGNSSVSFGSNEAGGNKEITAEDVEERMMDYLINYSAQLQSLADDEVIRISFGVHAGRNDAFTMYSFSGGKAETQQIPSVSMWITAADARKFRDGSITQEQFLRSVNKAEIENSKLPRDVSIFSSILETAAGEADVKGLRVHRNVQASYLPGWGAEFTITVRAGGGLFISRDVTVQGLGALMQTHRDELQNARAELQAIRGNINNELKIELDSIQNQLAMVMDTLKVNFNLAGFDQDSAITIQGRGSMFGDDDSEDISDEEMLKNKELLEELIVDTISEYGKTLSSLEDDEFLKVTLQWRGRRDILPEETQFFIKKSDLERGRNITVNTKS